MEKLQAAGARFVGGAMGWCRGAELNCLRRPFQGRALPVSYPGTEEFGNCSGEAMGCRVRARTARRRHEQRKSLGFFNDVVSMPWAPAEHTARPLLYFSDSSNSRIQSFVLSTSRGFVPSA